MATKPVVTIFEQYGAGATEVGRRVADALNLPFHAQAFSSEDLETDASADQRLEESATLARVLSTMGGAYGGFEGRDIVASQQAKYELVINNNATVRQFAEEGGVIVGRNGAVILAGRPNTIHVLLTGDVEDRVTRAAADGGINQATAASRQVREDDVRAEMSKTLYGWDPRLPDRYDIVMNTSRIQIDAVVEAILSMLKVNP